MTGTKQKRALTLSEAAEHACVSYQTVRGWITRGLLPFEQLPGRGNGSKRFILIPREDLDNFLSQQRVE